MSALASLLLLVAVSAEAEPAAPAAAGQAPAAAVSAPADYDEDLDGDPAEPDFEVITLPTNLRLPRGKLALRFSHRFNRPLDEGDFSDLAADLFGLDGGAQVGIGLRYAPFRGTHLGVYRTSDRTIQLELRQGLLREGRGPVGVSLLASIEGLENLGEDHSPTFGLSISRTLGARGAVYVVPSWVGNTRIVASAPGTEDSTLVLGLGARVHLTRRLSLLAEVHPRLAGYRGDLGSGDPDPIVTFGLESRVGGHAFQLNVSNAQGTTPAQVARGAQGLDGWFVGFNLTRKFY